MTPADQAAERLEALLHYLELIDRDGLGSAGRHAARMRPASDSFAADLKRLLSERRKPDPLGEGALATPLLTPAQCMNCVNEAAHDHP